MDPVRLKITVRRGLSRWACLDGAYSFETGEHEILTDDPALVQAAKDAHDAQVGVVVQVRKARTSDKGGSR